MSEVEDSDLFSCYTHSVGMGVGRRNEFRREEGSRYSRSEGGEDILYKRPHTVW